MNCLESRWLTVSVTSSVRLSSGLRQPAKPLCSPFSTARLGSTRHPRSTVMPTMGPVCGVALLRAALPCGSLLGIVNAAAGGGRCWVDADGLCGGLRAACLACLLAVTCGCGWLPVGLDGAAAAAAGGLDTVVAAPATKARGSMLWDDDDANRPAAGGRL